MKRDAEGAIVHAWISYDPSLCKGMAGEIAWDNDAVEPGKVYPSIFRNNADYMDINPNLCLMASYRDPVFAQGFQFPAIRLEGIVELEKTLKPQDYNERRNGQYRPNVGFTRDRQYANLSDAGHRMVNQSVRGNYNNNFRYGSFLYVNVIKMFDIRNDRYNNHNRQERSHNSYEQISGNQSSNYVGFFGNMPHPPPPPSFADMALGMSGSQHQNSYRGQQPYRARGGGRGNYRGNNYQNNRGRRYDNNDRDNGGPQRPPRNHDHPRHRPYENPHQSRQ